MLPLPHAIPMWTQNLSTTITVVGRNIQPIMDIYKFLAIVYKMIIKYLELTVNSFDDLN